MNIQINHFNSKIVSFSAETNISKQKHVWTDSSDTWANCKQHQTSILNKELVSKPLLKSLGDVNGLKILDAGCGEGTYCRYMAKRGAVVLGIDFSQKLIDIAKKIDAKRKSGIKYFCGSVTNLKKIESNSVDKVINVMVSMYLNDNNFNKAIKEFARVLKTGGELLFVTRHPFTTREKNENVKDFFSFSDYKGSYFSKKPFNTSINCNDKKIKVKQFPRTISEIYNTLIKNGFEILKIIEPQPSKQAIEKYKTHIPLINYSQNPMTLIIKAKKSLMAVK